ncbi:ComEC/Rec2 family competence protein [Ruminococcaceae bacterium OttesenSCG-928-O06]|nr:ComEC/Rec2 family competence protein [Ruminococcaceae bacterium OttesenSCG-928-O06]
MKRPLAVFGFAFLGAMLVALRLPAGALLVCGCVLAAAFFVGLWRLRTFAGGVPVLLLGAAALALCLRAGYQQALVQPLRQMEGREGIATARVVDVQPGYGGDTVHATLKVATLDGEKVPAGCKVLVRGMAAAEVGQEIEIPLRFYAFAQGSTQSYNYSRGFYLGASAQGAPVVVGTAHTPLTRLRQLQYAASANILGRLPQRLSGIAAAMAVGDRRFVPAAATEAYRAAGISHLMVVSGLHLSLLCMALRRVVFALVRRRRLAGGLCMAGVLLFMAFTGLTPSVVRSGIAWLLVFLGPMVQRRADIYTSLGFAAVVLLCANPWAAADTGLLLSFTATLGALGSGGLADKLRLAAAPGLPWPKRLLRRLAAAALTPLCVTLATLPVLVYAGMGVSLLAVPMNILAVPLLQYIVLCGFVMAIPPSWPVLGALGGGAAVVCGALLRFLEWLTGLCAQVPKAVVPVGGVFALAVVVAVYLLAFAGWKARRPLAAVLACSLTLCLAAGLHTTLNAGTVRVVVAGGGANPSLVVTVGTQSVVLYRSRQNAAAIGRILQQNNAQDCVLFIDMRRTAESEEYLELYSPQQVVVAEEDVLHRAVYTPVEGVRVYLAKQGGGTLACVDVAGTQIALCSGSVNMQPYGAPDVLVAGSGKVQGQYGTLITAGAAPAWAAPEAKVLQNEGEALIWIRPGGGIRMREVLDGA